VEVEVVATDRKGVSPMSSSEELTRIKRLLSNWTRLLMWNAS